MSAKDVVCSVCGKTVTMCPWRPAESYACSFRCLERALGER